MHFWLGKLFVKHPKKSRWRRGGTYLGANGIRGTLGQVARNRYIDARARESDDIVALLCLIVVSEPPTCTALL